MLLMASGDKALMLVSNAAMSSLFKPAALVPNACTCAVPIDKGEKSTAGKIEMNDEANDEICVGLKLANC